MLCIEVSGRVVAASVVGAVLIGGATATKAQGIEVTAHAVIGTASCNVDGGIAVTPKAQIVDATAAFSCPIEYIKSCFSLGGWDDYLGWDDELGWKD